MQVTETGLVPSRGTEAMETWTMKVSAPSGGRGHPVLSVCASLSLLLSLGALSAGQYALVSRKDGALAALLYGVGLLAFLSSFVVLWLMSPNRRTFRVAPPRLNRRWVIAGLSALLLVASVVTINNAARVTLVAWTMSLLLALVAAAPPELWSRRSLVRFRSVFLAGWRTREIAAVGCIVLIGAALRLFDLAGIPSGIHGDEAGEALVAVSILEGKGPNPFGTAFLGDRALSFYAEAPFLAVFGSTVTAIRLYSAVAGVATLLAFYLLMRKLFKVRPALIGLALLAGSAVHINYSRLGVRVNQVPLLACISIYCVWRGQESRKPFWWLASGIVGALAVYFAFTGALVAVTIALCFVYLLVTRPSDWRAWITGAALSAVGGAMALVPIAAYMVGRNDSYTEHAASRLVFGNWEWVSWSHNISTVEGVLFAQLKANLLYFFTGHDHSPFYSFAGAPMVAVVLGPLVALGLALMLLRARDKPYAMMALWFWTVVLFGGVLTINPPQSHRLLPAVLPALAGVALALDWLVDVGPRLVPSPLAPAFLAVSVALPLIAGYSDDANYFGPAVASRPWESGTQQARYVASLGPEYRAYSLAAPDLYFDSSVTRFLAPSVEGASLSNPVVSLPLAVPSDRDLAFMVFPNMSHYLPLILSLYPAGEMEEVLGGGDHLVFTALRVPRAEIARWQGLTARYEAVERVEPEAAILGGGAAAYPVEATWSGSIYVERGGSYRFQVEGAASELLIDGAPAAGGQQLSLSVGWHSLLIRSRLPDAESRVTLKWEPPDQPMSVVPARWLNARQVAGNLRGRWTTDGGKVFERRDSTIGFRNLGEILGGQGPVSVQWDGTLNAPTSGDYEFSVRSTGRTAIAIDGSSVVTTDGDRWAVWEALGNIRLTAGPHSIGIGYDGPQDGGRLEALWSVPGGSPSLIPPDAFGRPSIAP